MTATRKIFEDSPGIRFQNVISRQQCQLKYNFLQISCCFYHLTKKKLVAGIRSDLCSAACDVWFFLCVQPEISVLDKCRVCFSQGPARSCNQDWNKQTKECAVHDASLVQCHTAEGLDSQNLA